MACVAPAATAVTEDGTFEPSPSAPALAGFAFFSLVLLCDTTTEALGELPTTAPAALAVVVVEATAVAAAAAACGIRTAVFAKTGTTA